jgi:hypothetical protein
MPPVPLADGSARERFGMDGTGGDRYNGRLDLRRSWRCVWYRQRVGNHREIGQRKSPRPT